MKKYQMKKEEIVNEIKYLQKSQKEVWDRLVDMVGSVPQFKKQAKHLKKWGEKKFVSRLINKNGKIS